MAASDKGLFSAKARAMTSAERPLTMVLMPGETMKEFTERMLAGFGTVEAFSATREAMYAAVRAPSGDVVALAIPYDVDFSEPPPRSVSYGLYTEDRNPRWSAAPLNVLMRLTEPPLTAKGARAWRAKCWQRAMEVGSELNALSWSRGDILQLVTACEFDDRLKPGLYAFLGGVREFSRIQPLGGDRPFVAKGVASVGRKLPLSNDLDRALRAAPELHGLSMIKVSGGSDLSTQYVLLGHTSKGLTALAKTGQEGYNALREAVNTFAQSRRAQLPSAEVYEYVREHKLEAMLTSPAEQELTLDIEEEGAGLAPSPEPSGP